MIGVLFVISKDAEAAGEKTVALCLIFLNMLQVRGGIFFRWSGCSNCLVHTPLLQ
jgi:hypothetical protein